MLVGKNLFDNVSLKNTFDTLSDEIIPDSRPPDPKPNSRKQLAVALFYKFVLSIAPIEKLSARNRSAGALLQRPISTGAQDYETKESLYPLTEAIPKIEALSQTSGQAKYIDDIPDLPYQLFGALILANAPPGSAITGVTADKAMQVGGVVAFYDKKDIEGENNFVPVMGRFTAKEEIFCSGTVLYYGQPVGVLIGKTQNIVEKAAELVEITYTSSPNKPVLFARQILDQQLNVRIKQNGNYPPKDRGDDIKHVLKGTYDIYHQYHFHMETLCCAVVPTEDGLDVFSSTQYMDSLQIAIARMLNIASNKITVIVRRCGGAFGAKITRASLVTCAAALAAWKLRQPVRISLPLTKNMTAIGKRFPFTLDYEVGVNDDGIIQYLEAKLYSDAGAILNEDPTMFIIDGFMKVYNSDTFNVKIYRARTDTPTNTACRAPGATEGMAAIEAIMYHISYNLNLDPLQVRISNLPQNSPHIKYLDDIKSWANIATRKSDIKNFNQMNRWKKKGLSVVPMTFEFVLDSQFPAMVSIFHDDGTVQVSHGGIEIGQGINTKVAQVCAYKLGISVESVVVIPSTSFIAADSSSTGNTKTSEAVCYSVIKACDTLLERIEPYRNDLPPDSSWKDIINKCFTNFVNLSAIGFYNPSSDGIHVYPIYGVCATEVEIDVLTGQFYIVRTDLIEDTGQSMSPLIDIGQVEGAFVMGLGYHVMEKLVYNEQNGKLLTDNTWTYYVPGPKDIPADFRVKFPKNNPNPLGVLKSKGTGEPPLLLSVSVALALRDAVASARTDASSDNSTWYPIDGPTDVENVLVNCLSDKSQYIL